jgi:hypothetical protein
MIEEFLRLKEKVKNKTATSVEYRRYLSLLAKIENAKERTITDYIKDQQQRWK